MNHNFPAISIGDLPADEIDQQCPICLDAYGTKPEDHPVRLPCSHIVGASCIEQWIVHKPTCPICRTQCAAPVNRPHLGSALEELYRNIDSGFETDARDAMWANMMYGGYERSASRNAAPVRDEAELDDMSLVPVERSATDPASSRSDESGLPQDRTPSRPVLFDRSTSQRLVGNLFLRARRHTRDLPRSTQTPPDSPNHGSGDRDTTRATAASGGRTHINSVSSNSPQPHHHSRNVGGHRNSDEVEDQDLADAVTATLNLETPRRHLQDRLVGRYSTTYDDPVSGRRVGRLGTRTYLTGPNRGITTYIDDNDNEIPEVVNEEPTEVAVPVRRARQLEMDEDLNLDINTLLDEALRRINGGRRRCDYGQQRGLSVQQWTHERLYNCLAGKVAAQESSGTTQTVLDNLRTLWRSEEEAFEEWMREARRRHRRGRLALEGNQAAGQHGLRGS